MFSTVVQASGLGAAETVIATTPPINISLPNQPIILFWYCFIGGGTAITSVNFKLRRGTTTAGVQINSGQSNDTSVTTGNVIRSGFYVDIPGEIAGQQYSLTLQCVGNTGSETVADVCILAMQL